MYIVIMNNGDVITPESLSMGTQHAAAVILEVSHHGEVKTIKNNFARMFEAVHDQRLTHSQWLLDGSKDVERSTSFSLKDDEIECEMKIWMPPVGDPNKRDATGALPQSECQTIIGHGDTDELAFQDCIAKLRSYFL